MAKEFTVAEYGNEEKRSLGNHVGIRKAIQVTNKESTKEARANKRMPKHQDSARDIALGSIRNARKKQRLAANRAIMNDEERALSLYAEKSFPSRKPAIGASSLSIDECRELF